MHKSCSGYADAAYAMRTQVAARQDAASDRSLAARQMLVVPDENLGLTCLAGELWLTRDGDIEDYILGPGQSFVLRRGDQAAVQALKPSRVRLTSL
jgi:hypothetical protein